MPPVRSLVSKYCAHVVLIILLLGEIMPLYSYCAEKKLVYIIITAPFNRQPSSYIECIKSNIYLSCDIRLVSNAKYIFIPPSNTYSLS